ncbi:MAG: hypothetical protein EPN86_05940, partial [Nanoarchaeota archaeon]
MINPSKFVAVIYAAGKGMRLKPYTNKIPKCMLKVGNKMLLEHIVDSCRAAGIKDIVVIIGYKGALVKTVLGNTVKYAWNKKYATTQTLYSLHCARKACYGKPTLHIDADNFFDPDLIKKILNHPHPNALLVDYDARIDAEATKVLTQETRVRYVGKDIPVSSASGEGGGIMKLDAASSSKLFEQAKKFARRGLTDRHVFHGLNPLLDSIRLEAISSGGLRWMEIDFKKDLDAAKKLAKLPVVLIFAAGVGRRAYPLTCDAPKALLKVSGKTLIERQIEIFRRAGLDDIVVIVGHKRQAIKKILGDSVRYAFNPLYRTTQTMYSLWQARDHLRNRSAIIIMGDLLFEDKLLQRLLSSKKQDCAIIDFDAKLLENTTKVQVEHGLVKHVGYYLPVKESQGEYIGFDKFSDKGTKLLIEFCKSIVETDPHWRRAHIPLNKFG